MRKPHWWGGKTNHASRPSRDRLSFEALIGYEPSLIVRSRFGQLHRLKATEIADLIEAATAIEQNANPTQLSDDPELEADIFKELDNERQARLRKTRSATEVVEVLARMRTDATAEGLMALEFIALSEDLTIGHALEMVRTATGQQRRSADHHLLSRRRRRVTGCISLVNAIQQDPIAVLREVVTGDPIHASPSDDIIDITIRMADFNLLTLPVLDDHGHILGVITADDARGATIPEDWRRRGKRQRETILGTVEPG